ncbi:MAG: type I 3-dehydroquinate dehydratase [Thermoproteota archaeon]
MKPRICVSVKADDLNRIRRAIASSQRLGASLVELRLDHAREKDYEKIVGIVEKSKIGIVATIRPSYDGGAYKGSEEERLRFFEKALEAPFKYVDVEHESKIVNSVIRLARKKDIGIVLSYHDWNKTPESKTLRKIFSRMRGRGADVCKIVTTVTNPVEEATLLFFLMNNSKGARLICFGMGEKGFATRILSPLLGGFMTYASYDEALAPGQATLKEMVSIYREMGIW